MDDVTVGLGGVTGGLGGVTVGLGGAPPPDFAAVTACSALTRPAPKSRSLPLGPRSLAVLIRILRTSAGVSEGLRSIIKATTPLTSADATDVPVVN